MLFFFCFTQLERIPTFSFSGVMWFLSLLSHFPQTWSSSWVSCCKSSRMWWRRWRLPLRTDLTCTSTSCKGPRAAQGWGTTAESRTRITVSDCHRRTMLPWGNICWLFSVLGKKRHYLVHHLPVGEVVWSPYGCPFISPNNCSLTLLICMKLAVQEDTSLYTSIKMALLLTTIWSLCTAMNCNYG